MSEKYGNYIHTKSNLKLDRPADVWAKRGVVITKVIRKISLLSKVSGPSTNTILGLPVGMDKEQSMSLNYISSPVMLIFTQISL